MNRLLQKARFAIFTQQAQHCIRCCFHWLNPFLDWASESSVTRHKKPFKPCFHVFSYVRRTVQVWTFRSDYSSLRCPHQPSNAIKIKDILLSENVRSVTTSKFGALYRIMYFPKMGHPINNPTRSKMSALPLLSRWLFLFTDITKYPYKSLLNSRYVEGTLSRPYMPNHLSPWLTNKGQKKFTRRVISCTQFREG